MDSENLKQQFQLLQDQQQLKLLERRKRKEEANKSLKSKSTGNSASSFGVNDDLGLKISNSEEKITESSYVSEELVNHLNDQIRQIKDENGRLFKLVNEKDFEIRQLKKKGEDFQNAVLATGGAVTNETAASKIIELSKKIRELTAEKESEKTKYRQLQKKFQELQIEFQNNHLNSETASVIGSAKGPPSLLSDNKDDDAVDVKALQDRLKQTEGRLTDFRNQCQSLRQELKIAQKVLSQEIGENVNIQSLLNESSNWRGRAQQIIALQQKVDELKSQLETTSSSSTNNDRVSTARKREDKYKEELRRIEKERKEAQENLAQKLKTFEAENESLKEKLDAAKARNKVLTNENKTLKPQIQTLFQKSKNDDEFIDALMKQQAQLKQLLDEHSKHQNEQQHHQQQQLHHMSMKSQQDNNIVEQLKAIAAQKESQVKMLEMELQHLRMAHAQHHNYSNAIQTFGDLEHSRPATGSRGRDLTQSALSSARPISRESTTRSTSVLGGQINAQITPEELSALRYQCQELDIMIRALQVEKDKMTELVKVLQDRLSEEIQKLSETQTELLAQKRLTVDLEKKLGKFLLEGGKKKGASKGGSSARDFTGGNGDENIADDSDLLMDKSELQTRYEIQKDEIETLKAALKRTVKAKEEDLKIYGTTLEETKKVFLQALRQMKEKQAHQSS